jgi:RimJ/RimL family protein N-acetyltransferase
MSVNHSLETGGHTRNKMQLTDGKILLRPAEMKDAKEMFSVVQESMAEISPWMPWCHANYSLREGKNWIKICQKGRKDGTIYDFAITDARDGAILGDCGLNDIRKSDKTANLGYWVRTTRTKQGVCTAATLLLADFGFKELKLNRIEILVAVDNLASQRVAVKVGAVREGVLRNRILLHGKIHDAVMFSLIPK